MKIDMPSDIPLTLDVEPGNTCECGNVIFVITYRPVIKALPGEKTKWGTMAVDRPAVNRVVCPDCIDYEDKEIIIGQVDYETGVAEKYEQPILPRERTVRGRVAAENRLAFDHYVPPGVVRPMSDAQIDAAWSPTLEPMEWPEAVRWDEIGKPVEWIREYTWNQYILRMQLRVEEKKRARPSSKGKKGKAGSDPNKDAQTSWRLSVDEMGKNP